jgi:hypothetical protein
LALHYNRVEKLAEEQNIEMAIKFCSIPSGFQRLYMLRLEIPKDTLKTIWRIPLILAEKAVGKDIDKAYAKQCMDTYHKKMERMVYLKKRTLVLSYIIHR